MMGRASRSPIFRVNAAIRAVNSIALQLARAAGTLEAAGKKREKEMLERHKKTWLGPIEPLIHPPRGACARIRSMSTQAVWNGARASDTLGSMLRCWLVGLSLLVACGHAPAATPDGQRGFGPGPPDAPGPNLMLLDTEVDFGALEIGKSVQRLVRVENFGTENWAINDALGDGGRDFAVESTTLYGGTIAGVPITFLPYVAGVHDATVTFTVDAWTASVHVKADTYTKLSIAPSAGGSVIAPAQGIACDVLARAGCTTHFVDDVVLEAVPEADNTFVAWSDPTCGSAPTCTLHPEAAGRVINAYFAPSSTRHLTLTVVGDGDVRITDNSNQQFAVCRASCVVPVPLDTAILIKAVGPTTVAQITGACSGATQCSVPPGGSTSASVMFPHDPHVAWTRDLENPAASAVAYDSAGNLVIVTEPFFSEDAAVIKLDPQGHTVWCHPGYEGSELSIDSNDRVMIRSSEQHSIWVLGSDGYFVGAGNLGPIEPSVYFTDPYYFQRRIVTTNDLFASVGPLNGTTVYAYGTNANWTNVSGAASLDQIARAPAKLVVSVANQDGGADLATFGLDGTPEATVPNIAPHRDSVKFALMTNGDVISTSSTTSQISFRRVASGAPTIALDLAVPTSSGFQHPPHTMTVEISNDRAFWYSEAAGGFVAKVVLPSGDVEWTTTHGLDAGGLDVYDLARSGDSVTLVGAYQSLAATYAAPDRNGYGEGFVQRWVP